MSDPYGTAVPSRLTFTPEESGEVVYTAFEPETIPPYLKPIPINERDIHAELRSYLDPAETRVARWLYSTWTAEAEAIKYQEIRNALRDGEIPVIWLDQWQQDYSKFVTDVLEPEWEAAMSAGAEQVITGAAPLDYNLPPFEAAHQRVTEWIQTRGAELTVNMTIEQQKALRVLIRRLGIDQQMGPEELARYLRPVIGLTQRQTEAVIRLRESLLAEGLDQRKVLHKVGNYAGFLHRHRALRIARTELAFAYNYGQLEEVRQSVEAGVLPTGRVVKRFSTADDERVCSFCGPLDGAVIGLEETFPGATKRLPNVYVPPLHPHCRCAVIYEVLEEDGQKSRPLLELSAKMDAILMRFKEVCV